MRQRQFVGKKISLERLEDIAETMLPRGERDDDYSVAEIFLNDFEIDVHTDRTGRNAYSIEIYLDNDRIKKIIRIGHCHMCGGQGSDDELTRFPHKSLEEEAEDLLNSILE